MWWLFLSIVAVWAVWPLLSHDWWDDPESF